MKIKEIKTWEEFKTNISGITLPEWIFRGQPNSDWQLNSSLQRSGIMNYYDEGEQELLSEFKRGARYFLKKNEIPRDMIDWLALLQHHGAPTRMLDFTKSPYVAAFFAFEDPMDYGENISIWMANKIYFYQKTIYYLQSKGFEEFDFKHHSFRNKTFKKVFKESRTGKIDCILPIESHLMNKRYFLQQSIFLSPSNPYKEFNEQLSFLDNCLENSLIKILIPRKERNVALRDLAKMNISHSSLFPGIDGYAKTLKTKFTTLQTIGDLGEKHKNMKEYKLI